MNPIKKPKLSLFLHMYQPPYPIQVAFVLDRIIENSYLPLTESLLDTDCKLTVNINASLTEMLAQHSGAGPQVLENLKILAFEKNQIEFLESGAFHPLFPLVSENHIIEQIKLNRNINKKLLGKKYNPKGVFPPELALGKREVEIFAKLGYIYCLSSEYSLRDIDQFSLPFIDIEASQTKGLFLIRRNRHLSNALGFRSHTTPLDFANSIKNAFKDDYSIPCLGMDWETFGEHHENYIDFLIKGLEFFETCTLSEYIDFHKLEQKIIHVDRNRIVSSSWSTDLSEIKHNNPFPLWNDPQNILHQLILTLMNILEQAVSLMDNKDIPMDFYKSQQSCQLWWCARDGAPDLIKRATSFQVKTLEYLQNKAEKYSKERKNALRAILQIAINVNARIQKLIKN